MEEFQLPAPDVSFPDGSVGYSVGFVQSIVLALNEERQSNEYFQELTKFVARDQSGRDLLAAFIIERLKVIEEAIDWAVAACHADAALRRASDQEGT